MFYIVAVPSRQSVDAYVTSPKRYNSPSAISTGATARSRQPVHFYNRAVSMDRLAALCAVADAIKADVLEQGWSDALGALSQSYGSDEPDASNLLMVDYGMLAPDDPRYVATVERTWELLGRGEGLLMRYRAADDLGDPSSAFALIHIEQIDRARAAFERLLTDRNHLGLLGEDLHLTTRRQLGNLPQGYSHLALIDTAMALGDATSGWDDDALIGHAAF